MYLYMPISQIGSGLMGEGLTMVQATIIISISFSIKLNQRFVLPALLT